MAVYFVTDTNFFLQCKVPKELQWSDVCSSDHIVLVVVPTVYRELDSLKNGGNMRRAKRARDAVGLLRPLVEAAADQEIVLREHTPRVVIRLAPRPSPRRIRNADLDLDVADDRIIDEAMAFASESGEQVCLLSHDGMPVRTAIQVGLAARLIPDDWHLDPEPNDTDRKIRDLERQIDQLKSRSPKIEIYASVKSEVVDKIDGSYTHFPALAPDFIDRAITKAKLRFPMDDGTVPGQITVVYERALEDYRAAYGAWVGDVRTSLERLHTHYNLVAEPFGATLVIDNNGSGSADNLIVEIASTGALRLSMPGVADTFRSSGRRYFGPPPKLTDFSSLRPQKFAIDPSRYGALQKFEGVAPRRAVSEFAWVYDDPDAWSEHCRGECQEFRHKLRSEVVQIFLRDELGKGGDIKAALKITISATNMMESCQTTIPVRLECLRGDIEQEAVRRFMDELGIQL